MASPEYCFCFVCQNGKLEIKSLILAISLVKNIQTSYELIVAISNEYGDISPWVCKTFKDLNVQLITITNPIDYNYPIGNKLSCLEKASQISTAKYLVFVDSDILCNLPFYGIENIENADVSVRVANIGHWTETAQWKRVYDMFGLPLPKEKLISLRYQKEIYPYFNAGFVAIPKDSPLPTAWREITQVIYNHPSGIGHNLRWLDQISLPIAIKKLNLRYQCLSPKYNSTQKAREGAIFQHYHKFRRLFERVPQCKPLILEILETYPKLKDYVNVSDIYANEQSKTLAKS